MPVLVRTVLLAFGAVVMLFAVYEVIERVWLSDLEIHVLHVLHRVRGLLSALLAATIVGWFILRRSQPLLTTALSADEWTDGARPTDRVRHAAHARWFIRMRWIAVLVAGTLVFVTVHVAELLPTVVWWPLMLTVALLALLNSGYFLLLQRGYASARLLSVQAYADLILLTVLLHFSGGLENPLGPLMLFHVVIAGVVLSSRQCFTVATAGSLLFAALAWTEMSGLLPHYTLGIFPHFEHEGQVTHAALDPLYAASRVSLHGAIMLLTAFFVTNLTDRLRRDERQLEEFANRIMTERQLLERSLETTGTALCVCDDDLKPLWSNRQWSAWFDRDPERSLVEEQLLCDRSPASKTITDGKVRVAEFEADDGSPPVRWNSDHVPRTFQTTTAPLLSQEGGIRQVVQLVQDVTEQKRAQARILRAGKLAAVGELAGHVAHEVNNPIAIISAKARLLLANHRSEMSGKTAIEIEKITDLADRVARIAQGLLSYCRPSTGTRERMDVRKTIRKALALVEQHACVSGVDVEDHLPDHPLFSYANTGEMEQVFLNLLLNSLDAMPDGGRISVSAESIEGAFGPEHRIRVEDTGTGIAPEIRHRVFEPFFTTKPEGEGTGLGLSICLGLVRSLGGSINLAGEPGSGTRVTVTLPAYESDSIPSQ